MSLRKLKDFLVALCNCYISYSAPVVRVSLRLRRVLVDAMDETNSRLGPFQQRTKALKPYLTTCNGTEIEEIMYIPSKIRSDYSSDTVGQCPMIWLIPIIY